MKFEFQHLCVLGSQFVRLDYFVRRNQSSAIMAEVSKKEHVHATENLEHRGSELSSPSPDFEEPVVTAKTWMVVFVSLLCIASYLIGTGLIESRFFPWVMVSHL
jgi:hypothetical protein